MPKDMGSRLYLNDCDEKSVVAARENGLGIELDGLLFYNFSAERSPEITGRHIASMKNTAAGFARVTVHSAVVSMDFDTILSTPPEMARVLHETSLDAASAVRASKAVFHSDYIPGRVKGEEWIAKNAPFWKALLRNDVEVCLENFVDDDPGLMAALYDRVDDARFCLCFDAGHANFHSTIGAREWVKRLGGRIRHVHLHNNDGSYDQHRPLGEGSIDMESVLEDLCLLSPEATYTLEADAAPSLKWLRERGWLS